MSRPVVEIVRPADDHVEVYVGGRCVAQADHDGTGWYAIPDADPLTVGARAVAEALGAEVKDATAPMSQPWRYFVAYHYTTPFPAGAAALAPAFHSAGSGFGNVWVEGDHPIENHEDIASLEARLLNDISQSRSVDTLVILNFQLIDGPT